MIFKLKNEDPISMKKLEEGVTFSQNIITKVKHRKISKSITYFLKDVL
jgi:hypothetical protein